MVGVDQEPLVAKESTFDGKESKRQAEVPCGYGGVYTSVLVAMMGGVRIQDREGNVHPFVLFLMAVPVFIAQCTAICFLRADLPIEEPIFDPASPASCALLKLKWLMVVILYLTNYTKIHAAVLHLVFVLNPISWAEMAHPPNGSWIIPLPVCMQGSVAHAFFDKWSLLPSVVAALVMKFLINYIVCADSLSIILSAQSAKDVIFNGLAIGFVADLGETWWEFCVHTFHFESIEGFKFQKRPSSEIWRTDGEMHEDVKQMLLWPGFINWLARGTATRYNNSTRSCLSIGYGGNRAMRLVVVFSLLFIYGRQMLVTLHAIDTNVLPVARDLCQEYRVIKTIEESVAPDSWVDLCWDTFQERLLTGLVGFDEQMTKFRTDFASLRTHCVGDDAPLQRLTFRKQWSLAKKYCRSVGFCATLGFVLLILPQVHRAMCCCVPDQSKVGKDKETEEGQCTRDFDGVAARLESLERQFKDRLEKLEACVMCESWGGAKSEL